MTHLPLYASFAVDPDFETLGRWHDVSWEALAYWNERGYQVRVIGEPDSPLIQVYCRGSDIEDYDGDR